MPLTKRTFTIQASEIGFRGGIYKNDIPSKAAKKAAKRLFELVEKEPEFKRFDDLDSIKFILRETTKGSDKKTFFYDASKKELRKPKFVMVKAPDNPKADQDGYIKYEVNKEVKVATCSEHHVSHLK